MDTAVWYIRERFQMNYTVVWESLKGSVVVRSAISSCGLGLEEIGRDRCVRSATDCNLGSSIREPVEVVRVFEEL
jgi:hypothetical protein